MYKAVGMNMASKQGPRQKSNFSLPRVGDKNGT